MVRVLSFFSLFTFLTLVAFFQSEAFGQSLRSPVYMGSSLENAGAVIRARYPQCPSSPVKVELWIIDPQGQMKFQNTCYIGPKLFTDSNGKAANLNFQNVGFCYFREPQFKGFDGSRLLLRQWKINADCSKYADETGQIVGGYVDQNLKGISVAATDSYSAKDQNRLITIRKGLYEIKLDRYTGVTYELYNLRNKVAKTNSLHSHMGAALQVAIHQHDNKIIKNSCDPTQGYWNSTQAGSTCTATKSKLDMNPYSPPPSMSGLKVSETPSKVDFLKMRMANWDYGTDLPGPYSPLDTIYFSQSVSAKDDFVEFDIEIVNRGQPRDFVTFEIPTFYFNNRYRRWTFENPWTEQIQTENAGDPSAQNPNHYFAGWKYGTNLNWMTFNNTSTGESDDVYTIAWFYDPAFLSDLKRFNYAVFESDFFRSIKMNNIPQINLKKDKPYKLKYVIFPHNYNEIISTQFGRISVLDFIKKLKEQIQGDPENFRPTGLSSLQGSFDKVTSTHLSGWACLPRHEKPLSIHVYAYGPYSSLPQSELIATGVTSESSETSVNEICQTRGSHRFSIPFSEEMKMKFGGSKMFIHALHPFDANQNLLLNPNGVQRVPLGSIIIPTSIATNDEWWPASHALDFNSLTAYASHVFPTSLNDRGTYISAWMNGANSISKVLLRPRKVADQSAAFPISYRVFITDTNNSGWINLGVYTSQPSQNSDAVIDLGHAVSTFGVLIIPEILATDPDKNFYFQLADIYFK